jgi:hypothetical protein
MSSISIDSFYIFYDIEFIRKIQRFFSDVFARLIHSDAMILLDETLLSRGFSYVNRNRIKGPSGEVWITVPLKKKGRGFQKIKDLEIHEKGSFLYHS